MHRFLRFPMVLVTVCALTGAGGISHAARSVPAPRGVVSLGLESEVLSLQQAPGRRLHGNARAMARVEITSSHDVTAAVRRLGGVVRADVAGTVTTAQVPANQIAALARQPGVVGLFPARTLRLDADQSVDDIGANQVWTQTDPRGLPIQGAHVLVGIVDEGVDYHSADFKNPDGTTRIKYIWDQTQSGRTPVGFTFGYECDAASIQDGSCPERDDQIGHGTHVLGIAAGNGRSSVPAKEFGVAPRADIIVVKTDLSTDNIIAAWKYLVDKARQLGEPIVINNSFGDQNGPHDGSEPEARAIDTLSGPGRIFVKSAGNAGHEGEHAHGIVRQNATSSVTFSATGETSGFDLAVFYRAHDALAFTVQDLSTGEKFGPVSSNGRIAGERSKKKAMRVTLEAGAYSSAEREAYLYIRSTSSHSLNGRFRLFVRGKHVVDAGRYDAWMLGNGEAEFGRSDESDTMSIPGDARNAITVGNYVTSTSWQDVNHQTHQFCDVYPCLHGVLNVGDIAPSSSEGPTADGRHKPDIAAPGTMITSTLTHDAPICTADQYENCIDPEQITPDGNHLTDTGTSMAAPHVTGTIALLLQIDPKLDPATADSILIATARRTSPGGTASWNRAFGAGKLDALAAVQRLLAMPRQK